MNNHHIYTFPFIHLFYSYKYLLKPSEKRVVNLYYNKIFCGYVY